MSFEAKYRGRCAGCDEPIEPGQQVQYTDDELVHVGCEPKPDSDQPARNERRCPDCWTWHAGECI